MLDFHINAFFNQWLKKTLEISHANLRKRGEVTMIKYWLQQVKKISFNACYAM